MSSTEYLGLVAGLLTTFALVPQIIRVYKLKSAREISLLFNSSLLLGVAIWLVYGILQGLLSLIIWNSIGIFKRLASVYQTQVREIKIRQSADSFFLKISVSVT